MQTALQKFTNLPVPIKIIVSFISAALIGSIILSLPISQIPTSTATYFDHLFTAVSMVAVTGLYSVPVAHTYSLFGQFIHLFLFHFGGLGLITIVAAVIMQFGKSVSIKDEITLKEALNRDKLTNFKRFLLSVIRYSLLIELIGMTLLAFHFVPAMGWRKGLFTSLYLAASAFNNAGFDNLGTLSLQPYVANPIINIAVPFLIIMGGIGFSVWFDVARNLKEFIIDRNMKGWKKQYRKLSLHSRLVLNWTSVLLFIGTFLFLLIEWNNPESIGKLSIAGKFQAGFFQSTTMRTAGFGTIDFTTVSLSTLIIFCILMFIGGSPGGTAGGVKTSTFALVTKLVSSEVKGHRNVNYKNHSLPIELIRRALVIVSVFLGVLFMGLILLALFDPDVPFEYLFFEAVSALGTVGVTANLTPTLSRMSQSVIMVMMLIGRIGPITIFTALGMRQKKKKDLVYTSGNILIG
ncbi:TrkH family potassium uptake protein [Lacticigenium naphthae]|uniref:TrkH family potassium uptake protein n=1 Tax=Lacticigenium naphthae TaxID=515351 RepID=UPI0006856D8F|nr:potassium transporter TrkG [Lacticigenium naphthae]